VRDPGEINSLTGGVMSRVKSGLAVAGLLMAVSAHAQTTTIPKTTMPASFFGSPPCSTNPNTKIGSKRVLYVSPTGNDANNGLTAATAFKTVNNAFAKNLLRPGDLLLVAPGTYNESVTVRTAGAAGACITVSGTYGLARPVITWGDDHAATINVWVPYIRLAYLAVTHPEPNLNPKTRLNSANSAVDTHSEYVVDAKGVLRPTVHHVQIEDVTAYGSGCAGISFEGTDYVYAYGNVVYGNTYSQSGQCIGMTLYEPMNLDSAPGYHNYFLDNYSFGNTNLYPVAGTYTTDESGISIDDSRNLQALARNPSLPFIPYTGHTLIFGNILFGNGGQGIEIYSSDYVDIFNNVAYMDFNDPHMAGYPGANLTWSIPATYGSRTILLSPRNRRFRFWERSGPRPISNPIFGPTISPTPGLSRSAIQIRRM
jgi:parallel beta-helix repeat protein